MNNRSSISERNTSELLPAGSHEHATEQLHGPSSTCNRVYPDPESLNRSSHADHRNAVDSSRVETPATTNSGNSLEGQYQRIENMRQSSFSPTASPIQNVISPSVISQQMLPSYRQVSMSGEGSHPSSASETTAYHLEASLPDILHSHIVQQIPPPRPNVHRQHRNRSRRAENVDSNSRSRNRTHGDGPGRQRRSSRTHSTSSATQENSCKEPCVKCVVTVTSFRWVLVVLSVLGVSCVVAGIVLAALHPAVGTSLLYLSVMFIGLGVLLVIVVGVGWKCTPRDHEPLHALFGIGSFRHRRAREGRHGRYRNRDRNWFGGMLYPEFQYRRPPPTYAASMQDYQNQVSHEQEESASPRDTVQGDGDSLPSSPPPSYRSRTSTAHSGIHIAFPHSMNGDYPSSRPPTYRSRAPSRRPSLPHDDEVSHTVLESEAEDRALQVVSFLESSNVHTPFDGAQTSRTAASSSHHPSSGPAVKEIPSTIYPQPKQITSINVSQVYTVPLRSSSQNYIQNSSISSINTHNFISDLSLSTSSQNRHQNLTSGSQSSQRPPSLHQRMASEDRHILEQTLQSLEEHMNESTGFTNQGANFDEQDQTTNNMNTHL